MSFKPESSGGNTRLCSARRWIATMGRNLTAAFNSGSELVFPDFSIRLPAGHLLQEYQRAHPLYDRFLPHLASCMKAQELVIDVGANVGDTLAFMYAANPSLRFVCIEADDVFFECLIDNIARIRGGGRKIDVVAVKGLVGRDVAGATLVGAGGTKRAEPGTGGQIVSRPLNEILGELTCDGVRLLKTDVDGFDYDVLASAGHVIAAAKPLVFFELQYRNSSQYEGYLATIKWLSAAGYETWFVFDNFGALLLSTREVSLIEQVMFYVRAQNEGRSTRTIHYLDVLAVQAEDVAFVTEALATYWRRGLGGTGESTKLP